MSLKKKILFVDDEQDMLNGLRRMLRFMRSQWEMVFVDSSSEALDLIRTEPFDAIVTDFSMPGLNGLQLLHTIRDEGHTLGVLMLTGRGSESVAVTAMKSGANEYLTKGSVTPECVQSAIEQAIEHAREDRELDEHNTYLERLAERLANQTVELAQLSRIDPLTTLFNRRAWEESIELEHASSESSSYTYCVLMLDVDRFKAFNDSQGHMKGDEVLRQVAGCVRQSLRGTDITGRYGGEEFVVLLPETTLEDGARLGERVRTAIWEANIAHGASSVADRITVSVGVASGPARDWEDVVAQADRALYESKGNGRNMVSVFSAKQDGMGAGKASPPTTRTEAA